MPLQVISGTDAIGDLGAVREARWPTKPSDSSRIEPYAQPVLRPSFSLEPGARIFTIGSCFARNIERYLLDHDFELPTTRLQAAAEAWHTDTQGIINKYSVHSMLNELRWALEPGAAFPDPEGYLEDGDGWIDPQLPVGGRGVPLAVARERRAVVTDVHREVAACRYLIVTLGLAESWFDRRVGLYLNRMPPKGAILREPDRFALHVLSYQDVLECLEDIHALVKAHAPDMRFMFTVSPVPFAYTFRNQDALVANSYSKAVQRAAVEAFALAHDDVDYVPSFEAVMLTERSLAWKADRLHVADDLVGRVVSRITEAYSRADHLQSIDHALISARVLVRQSRWKEAAPLARAVVESGSPAQAAEANYLSGRCAEMRGAKSAAEGFYRAAHQANPADGTARAALARTLVALKRYEEAEPLLVAAVAEQGGPAVRKLLAKVSLFRARLLLKRAAWTDIGELARRALELGDEGQRLEANKLLGLWAERTGAKALAVEYYRSVQAAEPTASASHLNLARALVTAQRYDEAEVAVENALAAGAGAEAKLLTAEILGRRRRRSQAVALLEQIVAEEPDFAAAKIALARSINGSNPERAARYRQEVQDLRGARLRLAR